MKNNNSILEIRKRIPIGITAAKKLLEQTNFDVEKAEMIWKANQVNVLANKLSVKSEEASELLHFVKFEFDKALSLYKRRNTTDVEKILESSKKEEQILANFWVYISDFMGTEVKYGGWINEKGFEQLPELIRDILTIWQWYAFYNYEGVSVDQSITKEVISILEDKLELKEFALSLKQLKAIVDKFYHEHSFDQENLERQIELRNQLTSSKKYISIDNQIEKMEDMVMKKTYKYLYENSNTIDRQIKTLNKG